jgi:hypothetical protein
LRAERKGVVKRLSLGIIGLPKINNDQGEPYANAPSTDTTTRFQLSISVLIVFHVPTGGAFPHLVLVVGHTAVSCWQRPI